MWLSVNYQSRITGESKVVSTHGHKYYLIRLKTLKSITMATATETHTS
jgi:hypothetical protein